MSVASIAAFIQPHHAADKQGALAQALALGSALSAELVALSYVVDVIGPDPTPGVSEDELLATASKTILDRADQAGVTCNVVDRSSFAYGIGDVFADHLKVADLGILQVDPHFYSGLRHLANAAIFASGRPVILVPGTAPAAPPTRVLVAWDGTPSAARAMHDAIPLIALAGEVIVARVSDDKGLRPGQSGIEATRHLARHGVRATFQDIPRDGREVFAALVDAAGKAGCDLIVCGAIRHSAAHDLLFGSVTQEVLSGKSPVPVLLSA